MLNRLHVATSLNGIAIVPTKEIYDHIFKLGEHGIGSKAIQYIGVDDNNDCQYTLPDVNRGYFDNCYWPFISITMLLILC